MNTDKLINKHKNNSNIKFCKANVEAQLTTEQLGIQNLPCVIFFKDGKEIERVICNN